MAKNKKLWIDMCAGSELKDTQGETLSVEGADIEDLERGRGRFNDNHGKGFFNSLGRVTEAKKIFKKEDCENERHEYYWDKIKAPYIYAKGYLYSDEDHPNARAAAAIMRNIHREDAPLAMKASVEGGVISRGISDKSRLARTKIHSVALTFTPANNATLVEPLSMDKSATDWNEDKQLIKSVMHLAQTNVPSFRHIQRHASANTIHENIAKIQDLCKNLGVEVSVKLSDPETMIKQAALHKIAKNIDKINELTKAMNSVDTARQARNERYQQGMMQLKADARSGKKPVLSTKLSTQDQFKPVSGKQFKANATVGTHASRAAKDPAHLDNIYSQLKDSHGHAKATAVVNKIKSQMQSKAKANMVKALTAGYGGAGAPTNLTGGGTMQSESLEEQVKNITSTSKKSETSDGISYISCDNCGKEQVFMKHQVKCRECNKNFSMNKLEDLL